MRFRAITRRLALFLLVAGLSPASSLSAEPGSASAPIVALVPFVDHTEQAVADSIVPLLQSRLKNENVRLVPAADLRETLRSFRIRTAGMITGREAVQIRSVRPVDFFLLGSIDLYIEGTTPEAAFSLRLVRAADMRIIWAKAVAGNGEEYAGALGIGRISRMPDLIAKLTETAFRDFGRDLAAGMTDAESAEGPTTALVPFDNLSSLRAAGDLFLGVVLADLVDRGVTVIEPGEVRELFRRNNRLPAGGIDEELIRQMHDSLGAEIIITGTIDRCQPGSAGGEMIDPEIALGARCLDAAEGKIIATYETARRGSDSERLFKSGAGHGLGTMVADAAHEMLNHLLKKKT
ncbi:MAG: hypothetical protein GYA46_04545 [candidate division Zixibacteria bacterium]|nr:hypothetical protein [candidate division Zixibacteria bacterium]